jgi:hypothetical protein|tara:strand:+ start:4498 stop:4734 length:237 start_codon:yes stop_codon:yes gene_type:complete
MARVVKPGKKKTKKAKFVRSTNEAALKQAIEDAKNLYPVSESDVKKLTEAASGNGNGNIKYIKELKKRYDKIKKSKKN